MNYQSLFNSQTLNATTVQAQAVNTDFLEANIGTIQEFTFVEGTGNNLKVSSVEATVLSADTVNASQINTESIATETLAVTGDSSLQAVTCTMLASGPINCSNKYITCQGLTSYNGGLINIERLESDEVRTNTIHSNGNADIITLGPWNNSAWVSIAADKVQVNCPLNVGTYSTTTDTVIANTVNVAGSLTTDTLNSNTATLGNADCTDLFVDGSARSSSLAVSGVTDLHTLIVSNGIKGNDGNSLRLLSGLNGQTHAISNVGSLAVNNQISAPVVNTAVVQCNEGDFNGITFKAYQAVSPAGMVPVFTMNHGILNAYAPLHMNDYPIYNTRIAAPPTIPGVPPPVLQIQGATVPEQELKLVLAGDLNLDGGENLSAVIGAQHGAVRIGTNHTSLVELGSILNQTAVVCKGPLKMEGVTQNVMKTVTSDTILSPSYNTVQVDVTVVDAPDLHIYLPGLIPEIAGMTFHILRKGRTNRLVFIHSFTPATETIDDELQHLTLSHHGDRCDLYTDGTDGWITI